MLEYTYVFKSPIYKQNRNNYSIYNVYKNYIIIFNEKDNFTIQKHLNIL
jgi:hypothetical protein